jgi:L-ascorbate metabolism protein UlaG (beta-lactamase superfamily)
LQKFSTVVPASDHFDGDRFFNLDASSRDDKSIIDVLKWKLLEKAATWPKEVHNIIAPQLPARIDKDELFITYITHATELIQGCECNILTDPMFSRRAGPGFLLGPKRVRRPALSLQHLPHIDLVLISHNHFDHMDLPSLKVLHSLHHPLFIVPLGNKKILERAGIQNIIELDWWDEYSFNNSTTIRLAPAQHWSGRGIFDRRKALWCSYVIHLGNFALYFAGDTGYGTHFKQIADNCGPIDIGFFPIGAYEPRWFMRPVHLNPEEAVQAHLDLGSKMGLGMHYGTFALANEALEAPVEGLRKCLELHSQKNIDFLPQIHGETTHYLRSN